MSRRSFVKISIWIHWRRLWKQSERKQKMTNNCIIQQAVDSHHSQESDSIE